MLKWLQKRRQSQSGSSELRHMLDLMLQESSDGILVLDHQKRILDFNPVIHSITEYSDQDLAGIHFDQLLLPRTRESVAERINNSDLKNGSSFRCEAILLSRTGREIPVLLLCHGLKGGKKIGYLYLIRDRREFHSTHQVINQLSSAVERTADSVMITGRNGEIEYVNPAFEMTTGFKKEEVIGKTPNILSSGKHGPGFYKHLWSTILSGQIYRHLLINRKKDGELFYEELIITPVHDHNGQISHFVSNARDVTAKKQRERQQEILVELSAALRNARSSEELIPIILDQSIKLFDAQAAAITLTSSEREDVTLKDCSGLWSGKGISDLKPLCDISLLLLSEQVSFQTPDIRLNKDFPNPEGVGGLQSIAGIPLVSHEQKIGVLWVGSKEPIEKMEFDLFGSINDLVSNAIYRSALHDKTQQRLERLTALHAIDLTITSGLSLKSNLEILLGHLINQLKVDAGCVMLINEESCCLDYAAGRGFKNSAIKDYRIRVGEGFAGKAVLDRKPIIIKDLSEFSPEQVRNPPLLNENLTSYFVTPLIAKEQVKGVLEVFSRHPKEPDQEWISFLEAVSTQAAIAIDNADMFQDLKRSHSELQQAYDETIEGWARALELRDRETQGHALRVTEATLHLARAMGIPDFMMTHIRRGALLHDVGKLGIPDSILHKPGPLTPEEWEIMRKHPVYADQMLSPVDYLRPAKDIPAYHHERWDGSGYPKGLKKNQIPRAARIFAVIDVWDALSSDRPYRTAWNDLRILDYINTLKGREFDPDVVRVFLREFETIRNITHPKNNQNGDGKTLIN